MARRTLRLGDLDDRLVRHCNNDEAVYYCLYCPDIRGTKDRRGHLYINAAKGTGHCFRCNTTVRLVDSHTPEQTLAEIDLWLNKQPASPAGGDTVGVPFSTFMEEATTRGFDLVSITSPDPVHRYMKERHISVTTARASRVLANTDGTKLIFAYLNPYDLVSIAGFAERDLVGGTWQYSRAGIRNLYVVSAVVARSPYWVIVEGPPDALSLVSRGFPAVALGGRSMSEVQRLQLSNFLPTYIDIFFDADAASGMLQLSNDIEALYRGKAAPAAQISMIYAPQAKDPSQLSDAELYPILNAPTNIGEGIDGSAVGLA